MSSLLGNLHGLIEVTSKSKDFSSKVGNPMHQLYPIHTVNISTKLSRLSFRECYSQKLWVNTCHLEILSKKLPYQKFHPPKKNRPCTGCPACSCCTADSAGAGVPELSVDRTPLGKRIARMQSSTLTLVCIYIYFIYIYI